MKRSGLLKQLRIEAKERGESRYACDIPCVKGHLEGRLTSNGSCPRCLVLVGKKWEQANRERCAAKARRARQEHPERAAAAQKKWRAKNPGILNAHTSARRTRLLRAMPKWVEAKELAAVYEQAKRLSEWIGMEYHVDHIVPLKHPQVCGLHVKTNLEIIPAWQNRQKINKFNVR